MFGKQKRLKSEYATGVKPKKKKGFLQHVSNAAKKVEEYHSKVERYKEENQKKRISQLKMDVREAKLRNQLEKTRPPQRNSMFGNSMFEKESRFTDKKEKKSRFY